MTVPAPPWWAGNIASRVWAARSSTLVERSDGVYIHIPPNEQAANKQRWDQSTCGISTASYARFGVPPRCGRRSKPFACRA